MQIRQGWHDLRSFHAPNWIFFLAFERVSVVGPNRPICQTKPGPLAWAAAVLPGREVRLEQPLVAADKFRPASLPMRSIRAGPCDRRLST